MTRKILTVMTSLFFLQFAMSCIFECDMEGGIIEIKYDSFILTAWDTESSIELEVDNTVSKNSFSLEVFINREIIDLTSLIQNNKSFGFNSAYACSEPEILVRINDPIDFIEILVQDTETLISTDVSNEFGNIKYKWLEFSTLDELLIGYLSIISFNDEDREPMKLILTNVDAIPSSSIFTVNIYLESGIVFTEQTNQINFRQ